MKLVNLDFASLYPSNFTWVVNPLKTKIRKYKITKIYNL